MSESYYSTAIDYEENVQCWYPKCTESASEYGYCARHLEARGKHLLREEKSGIAVLTRIVARYGVAEYELRLRVYVLVASLFASHRLVPRYSI